MRGFGFGQDFIVTRRSCLLPSADEAPRRTREKKPLLPRVTTPKLTKRIHTKRATGEDFRILLTFYAPKFLFYEVILSIKRFLQFAITSP